MHEAPFIIKSQGRYAPHNILVCWLDLGDSAHSVVSQSAYELSRSWPKQNDVDYLYLHMILFHTGPSDCSIYFDITDIIRITKKIKQI